MTSITMVITKNDACGRVSTISSGVCRAAADSTWIETGSIQRARVCQVVNSYGGVLLDSGKTLINKATVIGR